jgi:7-cyano-7-deazaguanine synthase
MAKDLAIVLNSGGVNSAVTTAIAAQKYRLVLLHAEGAGVSSPRSRMTYDQQAAHFKPYREHSISLPYLAAFAAQDQPAQPAVDPRHPTAPVAQMIDLIPLIAGAVRFATHYNASRIYTGFRVGGSGDELAKATEYGQIWNELLQLPCGQTELEIDTPLLELEPWQVVDVGFNVNAPFDKTWSCLEEGSEPCWACRGCRAREMAFQQAAKADPLRGVKK